MNLNQAQQQKKATPKVSKLSSNSSINDVFRKSKVKESEFVIAEVCCSRHLNCMKNDHSQNHSNENNSFSLNSQLLVECSPIQLSAEPLIQYQTKPEVDMLAQINIKKKAYENLLKKCEQQIRKEDVKDRLKKLSIQAKNAIQKTQKSQKAVFSPKNKWGHSLFVEDKKNKTTQNPILPNEEKKQKRQIKMKPIDQRIKEYKQQQIKKDQEQRQKQQRKLRQLNVKELQEKIKENANKILEDMKLQKAKKDEQKKVIEAKIRALQLKSQQKVKQSKKKPFQGIEEFNLGDSQYSTFSARQNNRKIQKKKKKEKPKQPPKDQLLKTNKHNFLRKSSQSIKKAVSQNIKTQQLKPLTKQQQPIKQQIKGPFFIWNIPVYPNELQKIEQSKNEVFMNIERFNHKYGKTFREEANQYLTKKMEVKMMEEKELLKQRHFMNQVETKKQNLLKTFEIQQNLKLMDENFWNQDEVFKPNILENFHFYAK